MGKEKLIPITPEAGGGVGGTVGSVAREMTANKTVFTPEQKKKFEEYEEALFGTSETSANGIYEQRDVEGFNNLLESAREEMRKQQERGYGKMEVDTIQDIVNSEYGNDTIFDRKLAYLPADGKAIFIGDTHGNSKSTEAIIKQSGFLEAMAKGEKMTLVFMGDYIDRGKNQIRNLALVFKLKSMFPNNVILMEGNHDTNDPFSSSDADLVDEAEGWSSDKQFAKQLQETFYEMATNLMTDMTVTAQGFVAVHGGIPANNGGFKLLDYNANLTTGQQNVEIRKNLLWNDPSVEFNSDGQMPGNYRMSNERKSSERGTSLEKFNDQDVESFLAATGAKVILRGHQNGNELIMREGNNELAVVQIFSAGSINGFESEDSSEAHYSTPVKYAVVNLATPVDIRMRGADYIEIKDVW